MTLDEALRKRLYANTKVSGDCVEWTGSTVNGYGRIKVDGKVYLAHRIAVALANGCFPDSAMDVCHTCDNRKCVNPKHLFVGTRADNMQDCKEKGRLASQNGKGQARRLDERHKETIAEMLRNNTQRQVASLLGVSQASVWLFKKRYLLD